MPGWAAAVGPLHSLIALAFGTARALGERSAPAHPKSGVRDHAQYLGQIGLGDQDRATEVALGLVFL
ncbi:MAG: hypothetical protein JWM54_652 [Acidobacteriaceae bacterium]|nr:hypothetical protein [Acidobacteriaceae bacterium]